MKKIKLDLTKYPNYNEIFSYKLKVKAINDAMNRFSAPGFEMLGWKDLPKNYNYQEIKQMTEKANKWHQEGVEVLVVIGIGGSFLGAKAAIDFVYGKYNFDTKMEVLFAGTGISSDDHFATLRKVENRKFAICVISKSGKTLEPSIAFREFRLLLERKIGPNNAKDYIVAVTDANQGLLNELVKKNGYLKFVLPENVGGRFSVLTAVGLFPMVCAGIDVQKVLKGAAEANEIYKLDDLEHNDAYQYAVARHLLGKKFNVELLVAYEESLQHFQYWWQQLFGESEGKLNKGIFPVTSLYTRDLHSIGQFVQEGSKVLFETILWVEQPKIDLKIDDTIDDIDQLNYLINTSMHNINKAAFEGTIEAHTQVAQIPNLIIKLADRSEETLGALFMFFERAVAVSAYLLGVNPFNQPGVEVYKNNMMNKLKALV